MIEAVQRIDLGEGSRVSVNAFSSLDECAAATVALLRSGTVALSGGSTYASLFARWLDAGLDSTEASMFPVDERVVPIDDPRSNWGTACRVFLSQIGREVDREHFARDVESYNRLLNRHFRTADPVFDTVFLGMGDDGHTAGLFPGGEYLSDTESVVLATLSPKPPIERVTLAPRPLARAGRLVAIIAGADKAAATRRVLSGDTTLPIVKILSMRSHSELYIARNLL